MQIGLGLGIGWCSLLPAGTVGGAVTPNAGVGAGAPIMLVGNSLPIGLSSMWWGGTTGTTDGSNQHTVAVPFRAEYSGPISRGIGDGAQIGPQITTRMLWDRPEGEWSANNDPRRDLAAYAGGAMLLFEGYTHGAISISRPYFGWMGNEHRVELLQDLDFGMNFLRAAVTAGAAPYLGGTWPPLIENPPNDAAWRPLIDAFDEALRYRRDVLRTRLAGEGLADDLWIVPFHLMFARFYDDQIAGALPSGISSHRDFHALDVNGHAGSIGGDNHPYMLNPLSAYCAWCMVREVVMGEDASAMPAHPVDGVTADLAAYLRGVATDIVRSYAPAGRGGTQHAAPGYIEPVAAVPQTALGASFAASWIAGATAAATPPGPLDYGGIILSSGDLTALANTHVELGRINGPDGSYVAAQVWDWGGGDTFEVSFHSPGGDRLVGVQIGLPSAGTWLFEWLNLPAGLTMRRVDLSAAPTATDKVASAVAWPPEYADGLPSGATSAAVTAPAWLTVRAMWAGTAIPDTAARVGLHAWIDDLTGLTAWDGEVTAVPFSARMLSAYVVPDMPSLPPQLLPNPALDDPAAWTLGAGWTLDGDGASHAAGSFGRLTALNVDPGTGTDYVLSFDVTAQTSNSGTSGARGLAYFPAETGTTRNRSTDNQYHGWVSPYNVVPQVAHIFDRTPAQTTFQIDAGNSWAGTVENPRLYDVSAARDLPTLVLVVAGQSNAEGYGQGDVSVELDAWHPNIWMCPPTNFSFYGAALNVSSVAQEPLIHNGSPGQRVGPAMALARRLVSLTNGAIRVLIVPCARSNTGLVGDAAWWNPDTTQSFAGNRLFDRAVATTLAAIGQVTNHLGTLMLWSQGEADWQYYAEYPDAFANLVDRFKTATGIADLPVIVAGGVLPDPASPSALVTMQRSLDKDSGHANSMPDVTYFDGPVGSEWQNIGDAVHFTAPAQRVRGDYAGQLAYLIGRDRGWWT